jgi:hypothetical protein
MTQKTLTLGLYALSIAVSALATPSLAAQHAGKPAGPSRETMAARMIERLDTDKDGKVSRSEADAAASTAFAAYDADRNGQVTREEVKAKRDAAKAARAEVVKAERGPARQDARTALRNLRPAMIPAMGPRLFKRADTDKSGALSKAEVMGAVDKRFSQRDADRDGFITASELTRKI